jgi:hypothetical protein
MCMNQCILAWEFSQEIDFLDTRKIWLI